MACLRWWFAGHHYHITEEISRCAVGVLTHWRLACCHCGRATTIEERTCMMFSTVVWPHSEPKARRPRPVVEYGGSPMEMEG